MVISLYKAELQDVEILYELQVQAFMPLLEKYQDYETSPANETLDRTITRIYQLFTDYYIIKSLEVAVGGIRIVKMANKTYRVNPIFILPEHKGKGIAQKVFAMIEQIYDDAKSWEAEIILQEEGTCHLFEKLGYKRTGKTKTINDIMTIVHYEKLKAITT